MSDHEPAEHVPMSNPISDIKKLKRNSQASAAEISEFLVRMRGKSPAEVLGAVANSNLGKACIQATIAVAIVVLIFTAIPWGVALAKGDGKPETPAETEVVAKPATPEENTAAQPAATEEKKPEDLLDPDAAKKAAVEKMGVTEEKQAPANVNPLDGSNDDLLKGLE